MYGPGGLVGIDNGGPLTATKFHEVHFQASSINSFGPINAEIGVQLSQVPLASPVSGFIFANGVMQEATSFGPVLADRAETLGKRKIFVGASYEYFDFDKADSVNLKSFGAVFQHEVEPTICATIPSTPCLGGEPIYTSDIVATQNRIDIKVHQVTMVGTYGLSDKLDVSIALPIVNVRVGMTSNATIFNFEPPPVNHTFAPITDNPRETYISPFNAILTNSDSATGIGDLRLRGKYVAWRDAKEKSAVAVGLDLRLPTGDAYKFHGLRDLGFTALRHLLVFSQSFSARQRRVRRQRQFGSGRHRHFATSHQSPAAECIYLLRGCGRFDTPVGRSLRRFHWDLAAECGPYRELYLYGLQGHTHANVSTFTSTVNQANISLGAKVRPVARLLITGNVLFRLNDAGLHFKPSPLIGVSYVF